MISPKHRVIFIHIPKCAGQAVENLFLHDLNLSWDERDTLCLRRKRPEEQGPERLAHLFAWEYVEHGYISAIDYATFFKCAIIRDPADRFLSELNFRQVALCSHREWAPSSGIAERYIKTVQQSHKPESDYVRHIEPQTNFLFDKAGKKLLVDCIIPFENITSEMPLILSPYLRRRPVLRVINKSKKIWFRGHLSKNDLEFLRDFYAEDYKLINTLSESNFDQV